MQVHRRKKRTLVFLKPSDHRLVASSRAVINYLNSSWAVVEHGRGMHTIRGQSRLQQLTLDWTNFLANKKSTLNICLNRDEIRTLERVFGKMYIF
jgi:hypothetical protein